MINVQDAVRFGVSDDGYLRVLSLRRCTERVPLSMVETVHAACWRRFVACCGPGVVAAEVAKVNKVGQLPTACRGQWLDSDALDVPYIAQLAFNKLGRLAARQL